jgi:hypothetical protein
MMGVGLLDRLIMPKTREEFDRSLRIELDKKDNKLNFPTEINWICQKSNYINELFKIIQSESTKSI